MQALLHTEFESYRSDRDLAQRYREGVRAWMQSGTVLEVASYGLTWNPKSAAQFFQSLAGALEAYNRVLWHTFPYCRLCGGMCCCLGAATITRVDWIALPLLERAYPSLPDYIQARDSDCIYRVQGGCSWGVNCTPVSDEQGGLQIRPPHPVLLTESHPQESGWRPLKCALFFCLGGRAASLPDASSEAIQAVAAELERTLRPLLPNPLAGYFEGNGELSSSLFLDPIGLARTLAEAIAELLIEPFEKKFMCEARPAGDAFASSEDGGSDEYMSRLANLAARIEADPALSSADKEGAASDLETLEWDLQAEPERAQVLFTEFEKKRLVR